MADEPTERPEVAAPAAAPPAAMTPRSRVAAARAKAITEGLSEGTISWRDVAGGGNWRDSLVILAPAIALIIGSLWFAFQFVQPAPPKSFVLATGTKFGGYYTFGQKYAELLAKKGVTVEIRPSQGSVDNIKLLTDPNSGVQAALVQGGISSSDKYPELVSVGRLFAEPLWIFHRLDQPIDRLTQLVGKRIAVGTEGSGTFALATSLLSENRIDARNAVLLKIGGAQAVQSLQSGEADAGMFALAPNAPAFKQLINNPQLKLMSLSQADAYARRYPHLTHVVYPAGTADIVGNRPPTDVHLLAPVAALVVRRDLHPTIVNLLARAAKSIHASPGMFQKRDEFPWNFDPEYELAAEAENFYLNGTPFWQRYLPFWLATFIERMILMIVPILTIVLPVFKLVPMIFEWRIKRRIMRWYVALRELEGKMLERKTKSYQPDLVYEINRIDLGVAALPVPLRYQQQVYDLRGHIDLVRQGLVAETSAMAT